MIEITIDDQATPMYITFESATRARAGTTRTYAARVKGENGEPLAGTAVTFELIKTTRFCPCGSVTEATADADGVATASDDVYFAPANNNFGESFVLEVLVDGGRSGHLSVPYAIYSPEARITESDVSVVTKARNARFGFVLSSGATAECKLDVPATQGSWYACSSPVSFSNLADGDHKFSVRALDKYGPGIWTAWKAWTIDATPPAVTLDPVPTPTRNKRPTFSGFAGTEFRDLNEVRIELYAGTSSSGTPIGVFTAVRDRSTGTYSAAPSDDLADGTYTVRALQSDTVGNTGISASRSFAVDANAPTVTL